MKLLILAAVLTVLVCNVSATTHTLEELKKYLDGFINKLKEAKTQIEGFLKTDGKDPKTVNLYKSILDHINKWIPKKKELLDNCKDVDKCYAEAEKMQQEFQADIQKAMKEHAAH